MNKDQAKAMVIHKSDFEYDLPESNIALFPLTERDQAKLQVYNKGQITHTVFRSLPDYLPANTFLVFNNTKVISARLFFQRKTGATIEVFLLNPVLPTPITNLAMQQTETCTWHCMVGNKKKWKAGEVLEKNVQAPEGDVKLEAALVDSEEMLVELRWTPATLHFARIVEIFGSLPIPPYLNREVVENDKITYQTVYAEKEGAVAAPTAGLHFTERVFDALEQKGIDHDEITLHVSAGTFQPLKEENAVLHAMHTEQIVFTRQNIVNLLKHYQNIIVVGTTSMRALESLYWFGVKLLCEDNKNFYIEKLYPYEHDQTPSVEAALEAILSHIDANQIEELTGQTEIYIFPGYQFKLCKGIITNYHLSGSTLLLLIGALIGNDWKKVYQEALQNGYRFLSYGDSSLLIP